MDLLISKKGIDPITLDEFDIQEWLDKDNDNIAFCLVDENMKDESNIYLVKKSYFISPTDNIVFKKCVLNNNQLNVDSTNKLKPTYINVGFFMNKSFVIDYSKFVKTLNTSKSRIYKLEKNDITDSFINVNAMKMAHLELYKRNKEYNELRNLPHSIDIYFDDSTNKALTNYSYQWDQAINQYLIQGDTYFKQADFIKHYERYGDTKESAIQNVKDKISYIDTAFLETAPRVNNKPLVLWRGMKNKFRTNERKAFVKPEYMNEIGNTAIAKNYTSVSKSRRVAESFMGRPDCCLYKIILDEGMPYIDMKHTSHYKGEEEILLPRNIKFTLVDKILIGIKKQEFVVKASFINDEQFKTHTGCMRFKEVKITPLKINMVKTNKNKTVKVENSRKDSEKILIDVPLDTNNTVERPIGPELPSQIHKQKKCLNGTRRNKKTGECEKIKSTNTNEPTVKTQPKSISVRKTKSAVKRPRCPNGTRKNKKTGKCE